LFAENITTENDACFEIALQITTEKGEGIPFNCLVEAYKQTCWLDLHTNPLNESTTLARKHVWQKTYFR